MEGFRKKLIRRIHKSYVVVMLMVVLGICEAIYISSQMDIGTRNDGMMEGFRTGLIFSVIGVSIAGIIKYKKALKNELALKILYNQEHDERIMAIQSKAGIPLIQGLSIVLIMGAMISGYYNITIFYTLVAVAMFQLTVSAVVKIYCLKTM